MGIRILATMVCLALMAGACGSDDSSTSALDAFQPSPDLSRPDPVEDAVPELVTAFNDVGFDLLWDQSSEDNSVLSPTSIVHAVLMARDAADGPTIAAIDSSLGLPAGTAAHEAWNALDLAIAAANGTATAVDDSATPIVTIADRIWPRLDAEPDQDWIDLLARYHGADVEPIDVGRPDTSRDRINRWVSDQTAELIPELLPEGFVQPTTVLVLTDAIYFKAQWQSIFGKYGEVDGPFLRPDGSSVEVTFLRDLEQPGPRGLGDGYAAAVLPYLGDDFSMLLVVPEEGRFDEIRDRMSADFLEELDSQMAPGPYELLIPEWQTTGSLDLLPWLTDIGAAPGNYPGIGPGVFLSGGVHGADIAVDETGTVAAAATALGFDDSGPPEPELTIAADKPFIYVLRHVDSGLVLFVGQVTDPTD